MCDAGMDGDSWNPNTPSGKSPYARPRYSEGSGWQWDTPKRKTIEKKKEKNEVKVSGIRGILCRMFKLKPIDGE